MSHHSDDHRERHARAVHLGVGMSSPLWTAVWFSVGLGAAYWWWDKFSRGALKSGVMSAMPAPLGPSPEPARPGRSGGSGEAPVEVAPPELVMAHSPPPSEAPDHPAHPSDRTIAEPPPEMLAHTPPESVGVSFKPRSGFENPTHDPESVFPSAASEADGSGAGGAESSDMDAPASDRTADRDVAALPAAHAATSLQPEPFKFDLSKTPPAAPSVILATPPGEPVFDPEALATETSVAALTVGEEMDETGFPTQAIGEASSVPDPKPRSRKKPGTAPES